tara:strand:- start:586 stop:1155 length:570 start_codon:yes stop_codon:yes gene_type:complete
MDIKEYDASLHWKEVDYSSVNIGIVVSRFNYPITSNLLEGAKIALNTADIVIDEAHIFWVPGAFEIPLMAKSLASKGPSADSIYNAVICLGAVIRGETDHYKYIAQAVSRGLTDVALDTGTPIIFGVLTVDNLEQAYARSGGEDGRLIAKPLSSQKNETNSDSSAETIGNTGYSAGIAALEMISYIKTP